MAEWHPASESPEPPKWFVRELKKIDPTLRVVWAMERYLRAEWAVEREIEPERYWTLYGSLFDKDEERFIDQPVFDCAQPEHDPLTGDLIGYKQVGIRKLDLAPKTEHIAFRPTLDQALLDLIQKLYYENSHKEETAQNLKEEQAAKEEAVDKKMLDAVLEAQDKAQLEMQVKSQFGYGEARTEKHDSDFR